MPNYISLESVLKFKLMTPTKLNQSKKLPFDYYKDPGFKLTIPGKTIIHGIQETVNMLRGAIFPCYNPDIHKFFYFLLKTQVGINKT